MVPNCLNSSKSVLSFVFAFCLLSLPLVFAFCLLSALLSFVFASCLCFFVFCLCFLSFVFAFCLLSLLFLRGCCRFLGWAFFPGFAFVAFLACFAILLPFLLPFLQPLLRAGFGFSCLSCLSLLFVFLRLRGMRERRAQ